MFEPVGGHTTTRAYARPAWQEEAHDEGFERGRKVGHQMAEIATGVPKFDAIRNGLAVVEHQRSVFVG